MSKIDQRLKKIREHFVKKDFHPNFDTFLGTDLIILLQILSGLRICLYFQNIDFCLFIDETFGEYKDNEDFTAYFVRIQNLSVFLQYGNFPFHIKINISKFFTYLLLSFYKSYDKSVLNTKTY